MVEIPCLCVTLLTFTSFGSMWLKSHLAKWHRIQAHVDLYWQNKLFLQILSSESSYRLWQKNVGFFCLVLFGFFGVFLVFFFA